MCCTASVVVSYKIPILATRVRFPGSAFFFFCMHKAMFSFICRACWLLSLTCTSDTWLMTWIALYCDSSEFLAVLLPSLICMPPFPSLLSHPFILLSFSSPPPLSFSSSPPLSFSLSFLFLSPIFFHHSSFASLLPSLTGVTMTQEWKRQRWQSWQC